MIRFLSTVGVFSFLLLTLYGAAPIASLAVPFKNPSPDSSVSQINLNHIRRQNGNPNAAGDIYGTGLRIGAYLQIAGMLLSCIRSHGRSRVGILLLSSSVCLSLLTALTIVVARRSISPCEAWLILSLTAAYGAPRYCAVNEKDYPKGGLATLCCLLSILWEKVLYFWLFTMLYRQLPLLGTANQVWFFAPVDFAGWFRIFILIVTCLQSLITACAVGCYVDMIIIRFVYWTGAEAPDIAPKRPKTSHAKIWVHALAAIGGWLYALKNTAFYKAYVAFGETKLLRVEEGILIMFGQRVPKSATTNGQTERNASLERLQSIKIELTAERDRELKILRKWKVIMAVWGLVVLVLTIAGVEKIIEYNSLSPSSDLSTPGQIIPFILGIITFLVGFSHAVNPTSEKEEEKPNTPSPTPPAPATPSTLWTPSTPSSPSSTQTLIPTSPSRKHRSERLERYWKGDDTVLEEIRRKDGKLVEMKDSSLTD